MLLKRNSQPVNISVYLDICTQQWVDTDSNIEINFCENKTDGQEAVKAPQICNLSEKSSNQGSKICSYKGTGKRWAEETKNVNDAVKTIAGQSVVPSQNDNIDMDMHFCKSLVSLLKAFSLKKNSLARVKIQKVLFEIEFGENLD